MTRRARNVLAIVAIAGLALLLVLFFGGNWLARRQLAAGVERFTGLPCSIDGLRLAPGGAELSGLRLGGASGAEIEIDRLSAEGSLAGRKLSSVAVRDGTVKVRLPNWPCVTLTGVDVSVTDLEALAQKSGAANLAGGGNCTELNSLLAAAGAKARFTRGRFAVRGELTSLRRGQDIPLTVRLEKFQVMSPDGRLQGEAGSLEARVHLVIDDAGRMTLDARELAPFIGEDLSPRR